MAKGNGFGKFVVFCGVVGAAAAGAYYYMTQRDKALADDFDDDFDDFDDFDDAFESEGEKRGYVDLGSEKTTESASAKEHDAEGGDDEEESTEEEEEPEPEPEPEPIKEPGPEPEDTSEPEPEPEDTSEPEPEPAPEKSNPLAHIAAMMQNQAKHAEEQAKEASQKAQEAAEKKIQTPVETEDFFDDTN